MIKRVLIDLSSVLWNCLLAGRDHEFGKEIVHNEKKVVINSWMYGLENCVNHLTTAMDQLGVTPHQLILVKEGMNSKAGRQAIHSGYKTGREKVPQQYEQFGLCRDALIEQFLNLGAQMCWQDGGVESDDVIGYLAQNLGGERWILSGDKDLAVMVGGNVHHLRNGKIDENPFGEFPHRFITTWIALVGDSGDKIPGAKGFGEKAGQMLMLAFGDEGMTVMEQLIKDKQLGRLEEDVPVLRELQKVIDGAEGVYMSYELGRLHTEKVNTLRRPLQWRAGMVKPKAQCEDDLLRKYAGVSRIIGAAAFDDAYEWAKKRIDLSPYVSLDIETSTPPESDEWLESRGKADAVDVFGSELTSLQITFGPNLQYSFYFPHENVEEEGAKNVSIDQIAKFLDLIPRHKRSFIQNVSFELPICYMEWGHLWADDPEYRGFLRNVRDTKIMSSYVNENHSSGLKANSKDILGYDQVSYEQVTTKDHVKAEWDGRGRVVQTYNEPIIADTGETEEVPTGETQPVDAFDEDGQPTVVYENVMSTVPKMVHVGDVEHVVVKYKMNELTAREVLDYGCDDTICTAALANHFQIIMELEGTAHIFEEVETYPAYLTALAYVQGTAFSLTSMREQEKDDDAAYDAAWPVLREYLMKIGFEGTTCPVMLDGKAALEALGELETLPSHLLEYSPKGVKEAHRIITGRELETQVRMMPKLAKLISQKADEAEIEAAGDDDKMALVEKARLLSGAVDKGDLATINELISSQFNGEPKLDLASPKQMSVLLYDYMKIPVKVINDVTPIQREKQPELDQAVRKFKQIRMGKGGTMRPDELALLRMKAKADDTAIDFAVAFDTDVLDDEARAALKALGTMKKVMTRRSLFYKNYWKGLHWKDGKMHASTNQCAAVTRRYSMSDQNLTQLPKKGEGVRFRSHFVPHHKDAVIYTEDFGSQELRLSAETSQDKNMLACFVGDKLKDIHSITAAGAMVQQWGKELTNELFEKYGSDLTRDAEGTYELFMRVRAIGKADPIGKKADDLRKDAKNVNFGALNGAQAVKLSETLVMPIADAQVFLDSRSEMFPDVDRCAERIANATKKSGYAKTMMGARRHLAEAINSDERGAADRAARQAFNFAIQGSAGEMTKLALARIWTSGVVFKYDARFIAPVHDEVFLSVHRDHAVKVIEVVHHAMTRPYSTMKVPIVGAIALGPNLADQIECGEEFNPAIIEKAIRDSFKQKEAA